MKEELKGLSEYHEGILKGVPGVRKIEGEVQKLAQSYGIKEKIKIIYKLDYTRTQDTIIDKYMDLGIGVGANTQKVRNLWVINVSVKAALQKVMQGYKLQENILRVILLRELMLIRYRDDKLRYWESKIQVEKGIKPLEAQMIRLMLIKAECRCMRGVIEAMGLMGITETDISKGVSDYVTEIYNARRDNKGNLMPSVEEIKIDTPKQLLDFEREPMQEFITEYNKGRLSKGLLLPYIGYNKNNIYPKEVVPIEILILATQLYIKDKYPEHYYMWEIKDIRDITSKGFTGFIETKAQEWSRVDMNIRTKM